MRILRQTATHLVTQHHQIGERLAATCCLLVAVGAALLACPVPEISCQRNGTLTQCKLIRHIFGRWQFEQLIVLQGVRSESIICNYSRRGGSSCKHNEFVAIVQTQIGEIHFVRYASSEREAIADIQRFIQDSNQTSLKIRPSWSLQHPISNTFLLMFAIVMLLSAGGRLGSEQTYKCVFDKTKDWVIVTQQQMFVVSKVTEFPISSIKSITIDRIGNCDCIVLTLQSDQHVCVAQAFWGKKEREYRPSVGWILANKNLEKEMQPIASFLQV